jgi:hypothetical protein
MHEIGDNQDEFADFRAQKTDANAVSLRQDQARGRPGTDRPQLRR